MMNDTSSDSENEIIGSRAKLFGHEEPIHEVLGGGKGTTLNSIWFIVC